MEQLNITSSRLQIRNLQVSDLDRFYEYRSNPAITKYQGFDVMDKEACLAFIEKQKNQLFGKVGQWVQYAIEDKNRKILVGDCAIRLLDEGRMAEVGMTISHLEQQNGLAIEAATAIIAFLFDEKNIHRIQERLDADNIASMKLLKRLGFREEGHFIENYFEKGEWRSERQYAMLKREWDAKK